MCMILDNNKWGDFLKQKKDMIPIHNWINKKGKFVYSDHPGFRELSQTYQKKLLDYRRGGRLKLVSKKEVEEQIRKIEKDHTIQSNDEHILGLAKASDAKVLCTGDKKLQDDFKRIIKGSIYQNKNHSRLLQKNICM